MYNGISSEASKEWAKQATGATIAGLVNTIVLRGLSSEFMSPSALRTLNSARADREQRTVLIAAAHVMLMAMKVTEDLLQNDSTGDLLLELLADLR